MPVSRLDSDAEFTATRAGQIQHALVRLLPAVPRHDHQLHGPLGVLAHRAAAARPFMGWIPGVDQIHQAGLRQQLRQRHRSASRSPTASASSSPAASSTGWARRPDTRWRSSSGRCASHEPLAGHQRCRASASPRVFLGLGESGNFPAAIKATTEWFPTEERGTRRACSTPARTPASSSRRCSSLLSPRMGLACRRSLPPARWASAGASSGCSSPTTACDAA